MLRSEQVVGVDETLGPRRLAPGVPWLIGLTAVLVGTLVLVVGDLATPTVATASDLPRALTATPIDKPDAEVFADLAAAARAHPEEPSADGSYTVVKEYWGTGFNDEDREIELQQPAEETLVVRPDGSTSTVVLAASNPSISPSPELTLAPVGSVLHDFNTSEDVRRPDVRGFAAVEDYAAFFEGRSADDSNSIVTMAATLPSFGLQGGERTALLLEFLSTLPELGVVGTVENRLDESAVALMVEPAGIATTMLLFDPLTGKLSGSETIYTSGLDGYPITPDSVISYSIWKD